MSPDDLPADLTVNQGATVALHELFTNLTDAGFTERQALVYLAEIAAAGHERRQRGEGG